MILLLITTNITLKQKIQPTLSAYDHVTLVRVPSVDEALSTIAWEDVTLILLAQEHGLSDSCNQLRQEPKTAVLPIISIVSTPAQRDATLRAGATDTLMLPLSPAAIRVRLSSYLEQPYMNDCLQDDHSFNFLIDLWGFTKDGTPFAQLLDDSKPVLATTFGAKQADLYLGNTAPHKTEADNVVVVELLSNTQKMGQLHLLYEGKDRVQQQLLNVLGFIIGHMLETAALQEESQSYATQTAFLLLIAKRLAEQSDVDAMLPLALEHAINLLDATGGSIWLLSSESSHRNQIDLASFSSAKLTRPPHPHRPMDKGVLGWAIKQEKGVRVDSLADAPAFDSEVDGGLLENGRFFLAAPVYHKQIMGIFTLHSDTRPFSAQDQILLEGIARLLASSITNAIQIDMMHSYTAQQQALRDMGQQLAAGLDLKRTLNSALAWTVRLIHVEISLLWLVDDDDTHLHLADSHGLTNAIPGTLPIEGCIISDSIKKGEPLLLNDPGSDPCYTDTFQKQMGVIPQTILSIPLIYKNTPIGALCLLNKIGGLFDEEDVSLLSTAAKIITLAIGNARMHTQTLTLMEERERIYQQAVQAERLAMVGRLTASLAHEINNPMQAIKGAMALALEELDDPASLQEYIELALGQADRVAKLVARMRQIYRPQTDEPEAITLNHLLRETISVARKEMRRKNVQLIEGYTPALPFVWASANQLHLIFLNIILNICEILDGIGGDLTLSTMPIEKMVRVEFKTAVSPIPITALQNILQGGTPQELGLGLALSRDIAIAHGGSLILLVQDDQAIFRVDLPIYNNGAAK